MAFYKECHGGELIIQSIGDSPSDVQMQKKMKDCIIYLTLTNGNMVFVGVCKGPPSGLQKGNAILVALHCNSKEETRRYNQKLSAGGKADHPLEETFLGALFDGLTDPFGNHWLFNCNKTKSSLK